MVNLCPALTRTRASSFGYWHSTKGAPLDINDFMRLQGFQPHEFPFEAAGLSLNQAAGCLGNGMTLPLVHDIGERHHIPGVHPREGINSLVLATSEGRSASVIGYKWNYGSSHIDYYFGYFFANHFTHGCEQRFIGLLHM